MMRHKWGLLLLVPFLLGFDGSRAREALDLAFRNLYGADQLAAVELRIEHPSAPPELLTFAFGRKTKGGETRTLLYSSEDDRKAARALLLQRPGQSDRMYVSDGTHGRVRPFSTGGGSQPLFGSDFSYEDFRVHFADDFRIEVLGEDRINGESCRVLRLRPMSGPYEVIITWLSTDRPVVIRMDYFDRRGLLKRYRAKVRRIRREFDTWVTMEDEMLNLRTGSRTTRRIRNILVDIQVPDDVFTLTQLSRGRLPSF